jgi:hypothetical protein
MSEENKNTPTENKDNGGYHLIAENFRKSLILAIITLAICTTHWILQGFVTGNLPWFIINLVCAVGLGITFALSLLHSIKVTIPAMKEDLASFIISIATMAWSAIYLLIWGIDCIRNFVNLF